MSLKNVLTPRFYLLLSSVGTASIAFGAIRLEAAVWFSTSLVSVALILVVLAISPLSDRARRIVGWSMVAALVVLGVLAAMSVGLPLLLSALLASLGLGRRDGEPE